MKKISDILNEDDMPYGILSLEALNQLMNCFVEKEEYEKAAQVRDLIKKRKSELQKIKDLSKQIRDL